MLLQDGCQAHPKACWESIVELGLGRKREIPQAEPAGSDADFAVKLNKLERDAEIEPLIGDFDAARTAAAFFSCETQSGLLIGEQAAGQTMGLNDDPMIRTVAADKEMGGICSDFPD